MLLDRPGHEEKLVNVKNLPHFYIYGRVVVLGRNKNWSMVKNRLLFIYDRPGQNKNWSMVKDGLIFIFMDVRYI